MSVRGETKVIVHEQRPVPLWQHMLVGRRMFDLFGSADEGERSDGRSSIPSCCVTSATGCA